jgi:hypothetical protein
MEQFNDCQQQRCTNDQSDLGHSLKSCEIRAGSCANLVRTTWHFQLTYITRRMVWGVTTPLAACFKIVDGLDRAVRIPVRFG